MRIDRLLDLPEPTLWGADGRMYLFDTVVSAARRRMSPAAGAVDLPVLKAVLLTARALAPAGEAPLEPARGPLLEALRRQRIVVSGGWLDEALGAYATVVAALEIARVDEAV